MNAWNTKRYSARTLSVFEITGAYFANIFYNHLYKTAKDRHNISSRSGYSLTDEYKAAVSAYKHGITKDKKSYEQTVKDLLQYYRTVTKFITASMNDFIDTILQQFIPEEHFVTLNDNEKFFFMNKVLSTIVTNVASDMVSIKYLSLIIDHRGEDSAIGGCKDRIVEIQCLERDNMFSKFIKQEIGAINGKKSRSKQHKELLEESEKVDVNLCRRLQEDCETLYQKYQELLMAKCELEAAESRARKIAETLHGEILALTEENSRLKKELEQTHTAREPMVQTRTAEKGHKQAEVRQSEPKQPESRQQTPKSRSVTPKQLTPQRELVKPTVTPNAAPTEVKNSRRKGASSSEKQVEPLINKPIAKPAEKPVEKPIKKQTDEDIDSYNSDNSVESANSSQSVESFESLNLDEPRGRFEKNPPLYNKDNKDNQDDPDDNMFLRDLDL